MNVNRLLKWAFVVSVLVYGVVAFALAGPPRWGLPLVPAEPPLALLVPLLGLLALADWGIGMALSRTASPPALFHQVSTQTPWSRTRFVLAAAFVESGALFGLVLSLLGHDSRYALVAAAISAVLLLLLPE